MDANSPTGMELVKLVTNYLAHCEAFSTYLQQIHQPIQHTASLTEEKLELMSKQVLLDLFRDWKNGQA